MEVIMNKKQNLIKLHLITGETVETITNLGLKDYTALIIAFFKKEELADFFSSIASLL